MEYEQRTKIAVAMSGGVDSSVTAALLKEQGHEVHGVFMALAQPDLDAQVERVRHIADFLNIPLEIIDLTKSFRQEVLDYFSSSYQAGKTPNPCVVCNRTIKCGKLLDRVRALGIELMATGHYARIERLLDGTVKLCKGKDPAKDQSYFLAMLTQVQLQSLHFPLGGLLKEEVRKMAAALCLTERHGAESQDVCFLEGNDVAGFIESHGEQVTAPGPIITLAGREIGRHHGIHRYTVGQRRGLGIPDATPYYVVGLDCARNAVLVGKKQDLWRSELVAGNVSWVSGKAPSFSKSYQVKIRYRHEAAPAHLSEAAAGGVVAKFDEPQRAITPGQFAVIYDGDCVLGGGVITHSHP